MQHLVVINDWRGDSLYHSMFNGIILSNIPDIQITLIDTIQRDNIFEAAFVLRASVYQYPPETIFILGVNSVVQKNAGYLYTKILNRHIFSSNNGFLGLFNDFLNEVEVRILPYKKTTFPEIDVFVPALIHLLDNGHLNDYAPKVDKVERFTALIPEFQKNQIIASVIYVDVYGNIITNILKSSFEKVLNNRRFVIYPGTKYIKIEKISDSYDDVENMEVFAIFNNADLLEIGIKNSSISEYYSLKFMSNITVEIYDT